MKTLNNIKFFVSDVDGVWTDDTYYYLGDGTQMRKFSTKDSAGLLLLREAGIETIIVSGDDCIASRRRFKDLGVKGYFGVKNKGDFLKQWVKDNELNFSQLVYIGNDLNDIPAFKLVPHSYAPNDTNDFVKKHVRHILNNHPAPGNGFFRHVVERFLSKSNLLEVCYKKIIV